MTLSYDPKELAASDNDQTSNWSPPKLEVPLQTAKSTDCSRPSYKLNM